ncbi:MAG: phage tail sheath subtilisin-like domain-containing protein, partial [Salinimicrobium sediminis]|nr:phage tail sheath subtilisin-like domain-containing protein [Salinimicrobium sediminis]
MEYQVLVFGQKLSSGSKPALQVDLVSNADQAVDYYGAGSQLARMLDKYFQNNPSTKTYVVAMEDDGGGADASGDITFSGTATKAGTIFAYIGGERFTVSVAVGDTSADVATALFNAINANNNCAALATNGTPSETTITAKNAGEVGNEIDIRLNYFIGEELPEGITAVVTGMSGGTSNPDVQDVIDILGDEWYNIWIGPYTDAANLTAIETELNIRFGPTKQIDAVYFASKRDTLGNLVTFGTGRNSPHVSIIYGTGIPNTAEEIAAAYGGQVSLEGQADPARPFQTLVLSGILSPKSVDRFTAEENNTLLNSGIATFQVDSGGNVRIQRAITMYQTNAQSAPSIAYLDVNTMLTLMFLRYDFRTQILTKYPRAKLADDGTILPTGQQILTPNGGRAEAVAIFRGWQALGLVENIDQFKNDLVVERDVSDPNRMNWLLPPDLINQF